MDDIIDVTPGLIARVDESYKAKCMSNASLPRLAKKLDEGKATYDDAYKYAEAIGKARADAFAHEISSDVLPDGKMYYNIADRLINETLGADHEVISEYASGVQTLLNEKSGISLAAQTADLDTDRIKGFIEGICHAEVYDDVAWKLGEPVVTHARSVVDDTVKKNAEFQHNAGIKATVIRNAVTNCCEWCNDLGGDYTYPNVPSEVFQRHDNCRCTVDYEGRRLSAYTVNDSNSIWGMRDTHTFRDLGEQERIDARRQEAIRIAEEERNRKIHYGKVERFDRDYHVINARPVSNAFENNIYIEDSANISPRELRWVNNTITESKKALGIANECKIPVVIVNDDNVLASYNPRTDIMFVSSKMANQRNVLELQQGFAAANNPNSTMAHELIHWTDANEYRKLYGDITSAEPLSEYSIYQRERAIEKLEEAGIDLSNMKQIQNISEYAYQKALVNEYEEVYDEYRVKVLFGE